MLISVRSHPFLRYLINVMYEHTVYGWYGTQRCGTGTIGTVRNFLTSGTGTVTY
jgi:hypothetical protein